MLAPPLTHQIFRLRSFQAVGFVDVLADHFSYLGRILGSAEDPLQLRRGGVKELQSSYELHLMSPRCGSQTISLRPSEVEILLLPPQPIRG